MIKISTFSRPRSLQTLLNGALLCLLGVSFPALAQACGVVGNVRVRNQATLGGNLAEADYASDPPAVLCALQAVVTATSSRGARQIPLSEFFRGFYTTALQPDELLSDIFVPSLPPGARTVYLKYKSRSSEDRPCVGEPLLLFKRCL